MVVGNTDLAEVQNLALISSSTVLDAVESMLAPAESEPVVVGSSAAVLTNWP